MLAELNDPQATNSKIADTETVVSKPSSDQIATGLKVALNILDKWQSKEEQKQAILGMSRSTYYKCKANPKSARLSQDQVERISYILNIHQALRIVFSNPENVYGFMTMVNHNPYFEGQTPLALIATGRFGTLYEVFKRIDAMRGGHC